MSTQTTQQWLNINQVIAQYLNESEESANKKFKVWQIAFRGMESMGLDFFYQIKSVKLPINSNYTVNLPDDYLNYTKIGVLNSGGEIIPLKYNSKLTTYADLLPERLGKTEDNTLFDLFQFNMPIWYNYWDGISYNTLYGLPSGSPFVGSFKVDNANGVILLDAGFSYSYLMVEYLSSPKEGGDYYVPVQFRQALISFIYWKNLSPKLLGSAVWERMKRDFYNERRLARERYQPFDLMQAYEWSLESQRLCVKS